MSFALYFRIALLFPLAGGILSFLIPPPYGFLALGLMAYGVPYAVFAVAMGLWSIHRSGHALRVASLLLPVLFVPVLLLFGLDFSANPRPPIGIGSMAIEYAKTGMLTLLVGYVYVAFAWALWAFIFKIGNLCKDA
jgi:hypothetical protein